MKYNPDLESGFQTNALCFPTIGYYLLLQRSTYSSCSGGTLHIIPITYYFSHVTGHLQIMKSV